MKKDSGHTAVESLLAFAMVAAVIAGGIGWVWSILKLVMMADGGLSAMLAVSIVGIFFAPLGVVMGYL